MKLKKYRIALALLILGAAFLAGYLLRGPQPASPHNHANAAVAAEPEKDIIWTCSMHPQIQLHEPGQCPICFMDLIPLEEETGNDSGDRQLTVSESAARLMQIETQPVMRRFVTREIDMVGEVDYDETRLAFITARFPGRLDRLFVDYTGIPVKQGEHMAEIYSPELLSAQQELLQALKALHNLPADAGVSVRQMAETTVEAVREKLRLWNLSDKQIEAIEQRGAASDRLVINAPVSGIVIHKNANAGMYVDTGTKIYTLADLSRVWVLLEAYESDLAWLRYGQQVTFTTESYPGETFTGHISFIDPVLNRGTRTIPVRVTVSNETLRLKPGMFIRARVQSQLNTDGDVVDPDLAGKWISPMHPEIVKDEPGTCDICSMPLVKAETLGYAHRDPARQPLVIPAEAPLLTGKRAVVYVQLPNREKPTFEGREITLGHRAGPWYIVKGGLHEGEQVVTHGNFKLDAELQIRAKPGMMSITADEEEPAESMTDMPHAHHQTESESVNPQFTEAIDRLINRYLQLQGALANDEYKTAQQAVTALSTVAEKIPADNLSTAQRKTWKKQQNDLTIILKSARESDNIGQLRSAFALLSEQMMELAEDYRPNHTALYEFHCPMAFDNRGANWLQQSETTANPYYGSAMLRCGSVTRTFPADDKQENP
jgi:Cu(I)/Ag(I) efflux system membrane fusion protein